VIERILVGHRDEQRLEPKLARGPRQALRIEPACGVVAERDVGDSLDLARVSSGRFAASSIVAWRSATSPGSR
jgi:hypothetical protein